MVEPSEEASDEPWEEPSEETLEGQSEEVLFATGDLNNDGIMDSVVVKKSRVYYDMHEGTGYNYDGGLDIYFGDTQDQYHFYRCYDNITIPYYAEHYEWETLAIEDGYLVIIPTFKAYNNYKYAYILQYQDNDFILAGFFKEVSLYDYEAYYYDMESNAVEWDIHERDEEPQEYTYFMKDLPLKKLSEIRIGEWACNFYDYAIVFMESGNNKEALSYNELEPEYSEGDLNGDGIEDLVINVKDQTFGVYLQDNEGVYHLNCTGYSYDRDTETNATIQNDGNLGVHSFTESSKDYTFRYEDGKFLLVSFEQWMEWPDGGGSYFQSIDFVNGKRIEREDEGDENVYDIPQRPLSSLEEIRFGNIDQIDRLCSK